MDNILSMRSFFAPLKTSFVPQLGRGDPSFTRATPATVVDWESVVRQVVAGEARFQGARRVRNYIASASEDNTVSNGIVAANTTQTATTVSLNTVNASFFYRDTQGSVGTIPTGGKIAGRIRIAAATPRTVGIRFTNNQDGANAVSIVANVDSTPRDFGFILTIGATPAISCSIGIENRSAVVPGVDTSAATFTVTNFQIEIVTGQSNTNPAEYVSIGVLPAPSYHGTGIDGIKYFGTRNSNIVMGDNTIVPAAIGDPEFPLNGPQLVTNLLLSSEKVNLGGWFTNNCTVFPNTANDLTGNPRADTVTQNVGTGGTDARLQQNFTVPNDSATYGFSTHIQKTTNKAEFVGIAINYSGGTPTGGTAVVDTNKGIIVSSTGAGSSITDAGKYWRVWISAANNSTGNVTVFGQVFPGYNTDGSINKNTIAGASCVVTASQLERSTTLGFYVKTGASATQSQTPLLGYLAEGARTNIVLQSEDFSTTWTVSTSSVTVNQTVSPDGNTTADYVAETAVNAPHFVTQNLVKAASALAYAVSIWIKAKERTFAWLQADDNAGSGANIYVNLTTGAVSTAATAFGASPFTSVSGTSVQYPNGWVKVTLLATSNTASAIRILTGPSLDGSTNGYLGAINNGIYVWGAQLEQASFASSYIPTTTAAVTRNADVLTYASSGNVNASGGTVYFEATPQGTIIGTEFDPLCLDTTGVQFFIGAGGGQMFAKNRADTTQVGGAIAAKGTTNKWSGSWLAGGNLSLVMDGSAKGTALQTSTPTITTISIGCNSGVSQLFGTIRNVNIWPIQHTDSLMQFLTTQGVTW